MRKILFRKKKVVFIAGKDSSKVAPAMEFILQGNFRTYVSKGIPHTRLLLLRSDVVIIEDDEKNSPEALKDFCSLFKDCILAIGEPQTKRADKLINIFLKRGVLVMDYTFLRKILCGNDKKKTVLSREIETAIEKSRRTKNIKAITFSTNNKKADFFLSDINVKEEKEINFKVNHKESSIPFWIKEKIRKENISEILSALCVGQVLGINLAESSQVLKQREGLACIVNTMG